MVPKDTELWVTGIVAAAVTQSIRANASVARQAILLDNLGTVLQFQSFAPTSADADYKLKLVSQGYNSIQLMKEKNT